MPITHQDDHALYVQTREGDPLEAHIERASDKFTIKGSSGIAILDAAMSAMAYVVIAQNATNPDQPKIETIEAETDLGVGVSVTFSYSETNA